jgi:starch phosphorylase
LILVRERTMEQFARHGCSPTELRDVEQLLDPDALLVGFARRFATYKRADLVLRDLERFRALVTDAERPVQFIFAGQAHPADQPGQDLIRRIHQTALSPDLRRRVVFLENYDMRIGRHLVQGVDVWLNTPRRPHEACGTSGMKAAANGVLNCSILDGWWAEAHDPAHGWAIGDGNEEGDDATRDPRDADALYRVLREEVLPAFYGRNEHGLPAEWLRRMKRAMSALTLRFSTQRMVRDYVERYYVPALRGDLSRTGLPSRE